MSWNLTDKHVYFTIYRQHDADLHVHGSHTCMEGGCEWHNERRMLTEWGFKDAKLPLIRSIVRGEGDDEEITYYIWDGSPGECVECDGPVGRKL